MLDTGYWILDTGYWILDAGYWMLDAGCWMLDTGCWILDAGYWILVYWLALRKKEHADLVWFDCSDCYDYPGEKEKEGIKNILNVEF